MQKIYESVSPKAETQEKISFIQALLDQFGDVDKAIAFLRNEGHRNPVDARLDLQVFLNAVGREQDSFQVSDELMAMAPRDPRVCFNRGWHLIHRGRLKDGMRMLEHGRVVQNFGNGPIGSRQPIWNAQDGRGQRMILSLEGGLGDEMIHVRFAKELTEKYDCRVALVCQPSLADLFAELPWISAIAQKEAAPGIYHQSWLPAMSAPLALGLEFSDIKGESYLSVPAKSHDRWRTILGDPQGKIRVGFRWAGNPGFEHQQFRKFPPSLLLDLARIPELRERVEFYSFQRDDNLTSLPPGVADLAPLLQTWSDTAAAINEMDLVISSCTSCAHLSAALGKPTWVIVPALPYFVWALPGETSPWYESVTLFRQTQFGNWNDVKDKIRTNFLQWMNSKQSEVLNMRH